MSEHPAHIGYLFGIRMLNTFDFRWHLATTQPIIATRRTCFCKQGHQIPTFLILFLIATHPGYDGFSFKSSAPQLCAITECKCAVICIKYSIGLKTAFWSEVAIWCSCRRCSRSCWHHNLLHLESGATIKHDISSCYVCF